MAIIQQAPLPNISLLQVLQKWSKLSFNKHTPETKRMRNKKVKGWLFLFTIHTNKTATTFHINKYGSYLLIRDWAGL